MFRWACRLVVPALTAGLAVPGPSPAAAHEDPVPRFKPVVDDPAPAGAAAYVPGVDARGRPVVPADLPRALDPAASLWGWVTIPVRVRGGPARRVEVEVPLPLPAQ